MEKWHRAQMSLAIRRLCDTYVGVARNRTRAAPEEGTASKNN
jgi:hypothetical protein